MASNERTNTNNKNNEKRMSRRAANRKLIEDEKEEEAENHQDDDTKMAGSNQELSEDKKCNRSGQEALRKPLDGRQQHWQRASSRFAPLSAEHHKSQSHEIDLSDEGKRRPGPMGIFFKVWSLVKGKFLCVRTPGNRLHLHLNILTHDNIAHTRTLAQSPKRATIQILREPAVKRAKIRASFSSFPATNLAPLPARMRPLPAAVGPRVPSCRVVR